MSGGAEINRWYNQWLTKNGGGGDEETTCQNPEKGFTTANRLLHTPKGLVNAVELHSSAERRHSPRPALSIKIKLFT